MEASLYAGRNETVDTMGNDVVSWIYSRLDLMNKLSKTSDTVFLKIRLPLAMLERIRKAAPGNVSFFVRDCVEEGLEDVERIRHA